MERIWNGYGTDTERIQNGYKMGTGTCVEWQQKAFCQAFPVRFLLIGTVDFLVVVYCFFGYLPILKHAYRVLIIIKLNLLLN